jgi:hypothetical protein
MEDEEMVIIQILRTQDLSSDAVRNVSYPTIRKHTVSNHASGIHEL